MLRPDLDGYRLLCLLIFWFKWDRCFHNFGMCLQTNFGARNAVSISWKFEQSSCRGKNPSSIQFWFLPEPPEGVGWAGLVAPELWFELTKGFGGGMWESSWHVLKQVSHRVSRLDRFPLWLLFPTVVRLVRSQMATRWDVVPSDLFLRTTRGALRGS